MLAPKKRKRVEGGGSDPLKAVGFMRATKRGGSHLDDITPLEKKAIQNPIKPPKKHVFVREDKGRKSSAKPTRRR